MSQTQDKTPATTTQVVPPGYKRTKVGGDIGRVGARVHAADKDTIRQTIRTTRAIEGYALPKSEVLAKVKKLKKRYGLRVSPHPYVFRSERSL
jgi:hypothetical protein